MYQKKSRDFQNLHYVFFLLNSNPNSTEMCKLVPDPRLSKNFSPQETFFFQIQNLNNNNLNLFQVHKSVVFTVFSRSGGALGINFEPQGWEGALIRALTLIVSSIHCRMAAVFRSTSVIPFRRDDILLPRVQELMQSQFRSMRVICRVNWHCFQVMQCCPYEFQFFAFQKPFFRSVIIFGKILVKSISSVSFI